MKRILATVFVLVLAVGLSSAATTVYDDEADFLAAIGSATYIIEEFDGLTYGSYQEPTWDIGPENGFSAVVSSPGGLWSGDGNMSTNSAGDTIDVDYSLSENSVLFTGGFFFGSDIDGFYIPGFVTLTLSDGTIEEYDPPNDATFRGFVSDVPILSLSIDALDTNEPTWPTADHIYVGGEGGGDGGGSGVPAVSNIGIVVLMLCFMAASFVMLRRRRA